MHLYTALIYLGSRLRNILRGIPPGVPVLSNDLNQLQKLAGSWQVVVVCTSNELEWAIITERKTANTITKWAVHNVQNLGIKFQFIFGNEVQF